MPIQTPQNNEQLRADLLGGTGQFAGYTPISGDQYTGNEAAFQDASSSGVQEYNGSLYGVTPQSLSIQGNIPKEGDNIDVNENSDSTISGVSGEAYNQLATNSSDADSMYARLLEESQIETQNKLDTAKTKQDEDVKGLETATDRNIYEETEAERRRLGIQDKLEVVNDVKSAMRDLDAAYLQAKNGINRQTTFNSIIRGEQSQANERYLDNATMLNNRLAIVNDDLVLAQRQVDRFYDSASQQRRDQITNYRSLVEMSNNNVISLEKEEKEYAFAAIKQLQDNEDVQEAQKTDKMNLMQEAWKYNVDPYKSGVNLTDDIETIFEKLSPAIIAAQTRQQNASGAGGASIEGTGYSGFSNIMQDVINDGRTPQEAVNAAIALSNSLGLKYDEEKLREWSLIANSLTSITTPPSTITPKPKATAVGAGRELKSAVPYLAESTWETLLKVQSPIQKAGEGIGNFFSGLFGN